MKKVFQVFMSLVLLGAGSAQSGRGARSPSPSPSFRYNPMHLKSDESRGFARAHAHAGAGSGAGEAVVTSSPLAALAHKGAKMTDRDIAHNNIVRHTAGIKAAKKALPLATTGKEKDDLIYTIERLKNLRKMEQAFLKKA